MPNLPEHVASALAKHHEARSAYLQVAHRCNELFMNLARAKEAAAAAASTASSADDAWRASLVKSDGKITPAIQKLRNQSLHDKELAEELGTIAASMNDELAERQYAAHDARKNYLIAMNEAKAAYVNHRFAEAAEALMATPEGKAFADVLPALISMVRANVRSSHIFAGKDGSPTRFMDRTDEKAFSVMCDERVAKLIAAPFMGQVGTAPPAEDPILVELVEVKRTPGEGRVNQPGAALRHQARVSREQTDIRA